MIFDSSVFTSVAPEVFEGSNEIISDFPELELESHFLLQCMVAWKVRLMFRRTLKLLKQILSPIRE